MPAKHPDLAGLKRIDTKSAFFFVPESYQVIDMGEMGEAMVLLMQVFAEGMVEAFASLVTPAPGETATPVSLDEMSASLQFDLLMAADAAGGSAVFLVGEPLPEAADLQTMLLKAIEDNKNEVIVERTELIYGGRYPMARALLQVRDVESGQRSRQALYLLAGSDRLWTLSFQAEPDQFDGSAAGLRTQRLEFPGPVAPSSSAAVRAPRLQEVPICPSSTGSQRCPLPNSDLLLVPSGHPAGSSQPSWAPGGGLTLRARFPDPVDE